MSDPKDAAVLFRQRLDTVMTFVEKLHIGRWLLGLNVILASLLAGIISAGTVLVITIVERQIAGGFVAALAVGVSMGMQRYEVYRRSRSDAPLRIVGNKVKGAYRQVLLQSKLAPPA